MDWILVNQSAQTCLSSLGTEIGGSYHSSEDSLNALKEIHEKLIGEDKISRNFRRVISFFQSLEKDLIPFLISTKDREAADLIVRILVDLSVPIECLLPINSLCLTEAGKITIFELTSSLTNLKAVFSDPRTTRAVIDFLKIVTVEDDKEAPTLTEEDCKFVNNIVLLLRNVLHIPEIKPTNHSHCSMQNQILWNLFVQSIDRILIQLITNKQRAHWGVAVVQLIAVIFKDQHIGTLQKLLNEFEGSMSESSEENESNTSLANRDQTSDSSLRVPSLDPTSDDSSDNLGNGITSINPSACQKICKASKVSKILTFDEALRDRKKEKEKKANAVKKEEKNLLKSEISDESIIADSSSSVSSRSQNNSGLNLNAKRKYHSPDISDCGYASHVETQENNSTSSNEEELPQKRPVHPKPHIVKTRYNNKQLSYQEKKEARRKKLMKRGKTAIMNIKAIANHSPTESDITHILKEFTVDFLLKGYDSLVKILYEELLTAKSPKMDTSHFFWLIAYFLKFAAQLEIDVEHIGEVLSYKVISYLIYEGVHLCEQIEAALQEKNQDLKIFLRRQHLVVTAIREFIQTVEAYSKLNHLCEKDKKFIDNLKVQLSGSDDLKCFFLLLIRYYKEEIHCKQYLQDLVVTNHVMLTFLEKIKVEKAYGLSVNDIIKLFASADVMKQYGLLLEDFEKNGEFLNDCVLTMMHHVGGDINHVSSLCQPAILKTFTHIWESDYEICDDWSDLIEYVIQRFVNIPKHCPAVGSLPEMPAVRRRAEMEDTGWSKEECENLYWYFALSFTNSDVVANIIKLYEETGIVKTRIAVVEMLKMQGVIDDDQYEELLQAETSHNHQNLFQNELVNTTIPSHVEEDVAKLIEELIMDNRGAQLLSLQTLLLEACYVKLIQEKNSTETFDLINRPFWPVPYICCELNEPVPVVSWSTDLASALKKSTFRALLQSLGFQLPFDKKQIFVRIPNYWSAEKLFAIAQKVGPIDSPSRIKFNLNHFSTIIGDLPIKMERKEPKKCSKGHFAVPRPKRLATMVKYTPLPQPPSNWLSIVQDSKKLLNRQNSENVRNEGSASEDVDMQ